LNPLYISGREPISKELRINERIRAREVRVIGDDGEQFGVMPLFEALRMAQDRGVDLVEVAPTAVPPVCRLLDYGKYRFEQDKREKEARKNQKIALLKEVRMGPSTDEHDLETKAKLIHKFIDEGDKVKVTVRFRGRQMAHPQLGRQVLDSIVQKLHGFASVERAPLVEGKAMSMIITQPTGKQNAPAAPVPVAPAARVAEPAPVAQVALPPRG
jgi:translation initiation factor IF-3